MSFFVKQGSTQQKSSTPQASLRIPVPNCWVSNSQDPSPINVGQNEKFVRLSSPSSAKNFPLLKSSYTSTPTHAVQRSTKDNTVIVNTPISAKQKLNFTLASSFLIESKCF